MTDKQFYFCYTEIPNYHDRDAYISDVVLSSIWEDSPCDEIPEERIDSVGRIWDAYHKTVRQIASDAGLSHRKLAERFCIPVRTVEDWCTGKRTPPDYVRLMMQECLGILSRQ